MQELFADDEFANRFELLGRVGDGETVVYQAFDKRRGEKVALKFIDVPAHEPLRVALLSSLRAALRVRSPFVVSTYEVISAVSTICVVLEYIPGKSLSELSPLEEPLPIDEAVSILQAIVRGLNDIHRCGLVHRDLKRENVMVSDAGVVKIVDLGMLSGAQVPRDGIDAQTWVSTAEWIVGTPAYLAPEYFKLGAFDQRSDLYALGCLAYELLTGECPFPQRSFLDLVHSKLHGRFPSLAKRRPDCPVSLAGWVVHLLSVEPNGRYVDAVACHSALSIDSNKRTEDLVCTPDYRSRWRGILERFAAFCDRRRAPIWLVNLNEELLAKTDQRLAKTGVLCGLFLASCIVLGGILAVSSREREPGLAAIGPYSPPENHSYPLWSRVSLFADTVANRALLDRILIPDQSGGWIRVSTGQPVLEADVPGVDSDWEISSARWPRHQICKRGVLQEDAVCLVTSDQELAHPVSDGAGGVFYLQSVVAGAVGQREAWHRTNSTLRQMTSLHRPLSGLAVIDLHTILVASPDPQRRGVTVLFLSSDVGAEAPLAEIGMPRVEQIRLLPNSRKR